jgi:ATP-dependent Lon protease
MAVQEDTESTFEIQVPGDAEELPILTVRDTVLYPHAMLPITVGRASSVALVQSLGENRLFGVVSQLDPRVETPSPQDLYQVGTIAILHKSVRVQKENLLLFCEGLTRMRTQEFTATEPFLKARVERIQEVEPEMTPEIEALRQNVVNLFQQIVTASPNLSDEVGELASQISEPGKLADFVAGALPALSHVERQQLLEEFDALTRLNAMHRHLAREVGSQRAALAEPAGVLSPRAAKSHPEGTGRRRRDPAGHSGLEAEARSCRVA